MPEMLKIDEQYAILSEAERSAPLRVLKHGDSFMPARDSCRRCS